MNPEERYLKASREIKEQTNRIKDPDTRKAINILGQAYLTKTAMSKVKESERMDQLENEVFELKQTVNELKGSL